MAAAFILPLSWTVCSWADPKLPPIFADHMVLQQNQELRIWGSADPGEKITITLSQSSTSTIASQDGSWVATLPPVKTGGPFDLRIAGKTTLVLHDVLIGEVWIASGQSNMVFPLRTAVGADAEIKNASHPQIRLFTVPKPPDHTAEWQICSPETTATFSAVAYFFAREIQKDLNVPVGIILSAYGGTTIEEWSEPGASATAAGLNGPAQNPASANDKNPAAQFPPAYLYDSMIKPLFPLTIRGVIWYQGENNVARAYAYRAQLLALIESWRRGFRNPDLPFLIVQLPGFGMPTPQPQDSPWAELREAQAQVAKTKNVGLATAIDLGDGPKLHPARKLEVGERLAALALSTTYGRPVASSGPVYSSMDIAGSRVVIHFAPGSGKLLAKGGAPLAGFALAGADKKFHWADATIQGDTIIVSSNDVSAPVAVRYAWGGNPVGNLANESGIAAAPFRSDDWPGPTARRAAIQPRTTDHP